jgi:CelD/BcsL family acetyltransferase involved in cellulose biosynthesis
LRETVRRKSRKSIVSLTLVDHFDAEIWSAYETIYALSWKPGEGHPAFLRAFAEIEGVAGRLRLGLATIEGRPTAAQFWTVQNGVAYIHKLAHDERDKRHSPGTLLSAALFEQVIDRDHVNEIDFGTGDNPYKRDWMEQVRHRYRLEAFRPGAPSAWPALAKRLARRIMAREPLVSLRVAR